MYYLFQTMTTGVFVETTYTISIMYINANYLYRFCMALIILNNGWVYKRREGTTFQKVCAVLANYKPSVDHACEWLVMMLL